MGYPAFKIHDWGGDWTDPAETAEAVKAVGDRVGDRMDLMLDPACDDANFLWYENPYRDGGVSQHAHRKLRQKLDTPLLQTEHVRGVEPHADFVAAEATDFVSADPEYDGESSPPHLSS